MSGAAPATQPRVNYVTELIVSAAMKVHSALGRLARKCLPGVSDELKKEGMELRREVALPVTYDRVILDVGYRMDLVVENVVVVELKCVEAFSPIHQAQLLSYLKLSGLQVGLLINFHVADLRDGIKRMVRG